jgi:hypothetical protein
MPGGGQSNVIEIVDDDHLENSSVVKSPKAPEISLVDHRRHRPSPDTSNRSAYRPETTGIKEYWRVESSVRPNAKKSPALDFTSKLARPPPKWVGTLADCGDADGLEDEYFTKSAREERMKPHPAEHERTAFPNGELDVKSPPVQVVIPQQKTNTVLEDDVNGSQLRHRFKDTKGRTRSNRPIDARSSGESSDELQGACTVGDSRKAAGPPDSLPPSNITPTRFSPPPGERTKRKLTDRRKNKSQKSFPISFIESDTARLEEPSNLVLDQETGQFSVQHLAFVFDARKITTSLFCKDGRIRLMFSQPHDHPSPPVNFHLTHPSDIDEFYTALGNLGPAPKRSLKEE